MAGLLVPSRPLRTLSRGTGGLGSVPDLLKIGSITLERIFVKKNRMREKKKCTYKYL
jgi:hypothetical protein